MGSVITLLPYIRDLVRALCTLIAFDSNEVAALRLSLNTFTKVPPLVHEPLPHILKLNS